MELKMLEGLSTFYNLDFTDPSEKIDKFDDLITMSKVLEKYEEEKIKDIKEINTESRFEKFLNANENKLPTFLHLVVKSKYVNTRTDYNNSTVLYK